jgi:tetratricopeptide (TPR) repeat protein
MDDSLITLLLENLKSADEWVRDLAVQQLWQLWFEQKGAGGLEVLRRSQILIEMGDLEGAETTLTQVILSQPDFAEAWNRRAVLYFMQGQYWNAIADCEMAIHLNPIHFGALHGLGLSYAAVGKYSNAIQAFHRALKIQPHSIENQRFILECTARLN